MLVQRVMNMEINILAETSDYLVLNKPSGLVVHADGKTDEYTLSNWVIEHYPMLQDIGEPMILEHKGELLTIHRPGIVHRLDRETSGVIVVAKTQKFFEHIKKQFQDHTIRKQYVAIVFGFVHDDRGLIDVAIGRGANDIRKWAAGKYARGHLRDAVTRYVVTDRFTDIHGVRFTAVRLFPETGRTHQLRVHMKYLGYSIIGDRVYAPKTIGMLGAERTMLHAEQIQFFDLSGAVITVKAPLADDFKKCLQKSVVLV